MSRSSVILLIVILGIAALAAILIISTQQLTVRNGTNPTPSLTVGVVSPSPIPGGDREVIGECDSFTLVSPRDNSVVSSPLEVEVIIDNSDADCNWTLFEAQAGVARIEAEDGTELGLAPLMTGEDWMQAGPVNFTAEIEFDAPDRRNINLVIEEENPSGIASQQTTITIPLFYSES